MLAGRYRIGRYTVDFDSGGISLEGRPVPVHWRGFEALRELTASRGQAVGRDRLFQALWPGVIVDESNLGKVVSQLRRSLEENDPGSEYIETLPGMGYRLVAPVAADPEDHAQKPPAAAPPPEAPRQASRVKVLAATAIGVATVAGAAFLLLRQDPRTREAAAAMERGQELIRSRDPARVTEAVGLLRRATELDPKSARAYAALAHALNRQGAEVAPAVGHAPALVAARRAVELDPECGHCNGTYGLFLMSYAWQFDLARRHIESAIRISPNDSGIRPAHALLLNVGGHGSKALEEIDIALRAAPFHAGHHTVRARTLYYLKRYPESVEAADRAIAIQPQDAAGWEWKSQALMQAGQAEAAIDAITVRRYPEHREKAMKAVRERGLNAALRILVEAPGDAWRHCWRRARWKAMLGDDDGALEELRVAVERRMFEAMYLGVDPVFERLRSHTRFEKLLSDAGLGPPAAPVGENRPTHGASSPAAVRPALAPGAVAR